jgi:hypothetical protein
MNETESPTDPWRSLDGGPVEQETGDPDLVFAHVSDLHGQLTPRHQVYYDNSTNSVRSTTSAP